MAPLRRVVFTNVCRWILRGRLEPASSENCARSSEKEVLSVCDGIPARTADEMSERRVRTGTDIGSRVAPPFPAYAAFAFSKDGEFSFRFKVLSAVFSMWEKPPL